MRKTDVHQISTSAKSDEYPNIRALLHGTPKLAPELATGDVSSLLVPLVLNHSQVWGPNAIRLGFIGGAVATAISYDMTVRAARMIQAHG